MDRSGRRGYHRWWTCHRSKINISVLPSHDDQSGSSFDISGGGDLYAYRFRLGCWGGTATFSLHRAVSQSFPVINSTTRRSSPHANTSLSVGDQVFLNAGSGLAAGTYTLLTGEICLASGCVPRHPESWHATRQCSSWPDGSSVVSGYRFNDLNPIGLVNPQVRSLKLPLSWSSNPARLMTIIPPTRFCSPARRPTTLPIPRLPIDSGELVLAATNSLIIQGSVTSQAPTGGAGGKNRYLQSERYPHFTLWRRAWHSRLDPN